MLLNRLRNGIVLLFFYLLLLLGWLDSYFLNSFGRSTGLLCLFGVHLSHSLVGIFDYFLFFSFYVLVNGFVYLGLGFYLFKLVCHFSLLFNFVGCWGFVSVSDCSHDGRVGRGGGWGSWHHYGHFFRDVYCFFNGVCWAWNLHDFCLGLNNRGCWCDHSCRSCYDWSSNRHWNWSMMMVVMNVMSLIRMMHNSVRRSCNGQDIVDRIIDNISRFIRNLLYKSSFGYGISKKKCYNHHRGLLKLHL